MGFGAAAVERRVTLLLPATSAEYEQARAEVTVHLPEAARSKDGAPA